MLSIIENVRAADKRGNNEWLDKLEGRKLTELKFHDSYRKRFEKKNSSSSASEAVKNDDAGDTFEVLTGNLKYYKTTERSVSYIDEWLDANVRGKVFLDYACGDGKYAIRASKYCGAKLSVGFDLSAESVDNAEEDAQKSGITENTVFIQADAENTNLPSGIFDVILCSGMLHHLDLNFAFPELERLLAPGGKILCVEALDYNPLIKAYRLLTPKMRTEWEKAHILTMKDVRHAKNYFNVENIKFFHILGPVAAHFPVLQTVVDKIDQLLERTWLLKFWAWMFVFELQKK